MKAATMDIPGDADVALATRVRAALTRSPEHVAVLGFLIALIVFFGASNENFLTTSNWETLLRAVAGIGLIAVGQTLVIVGRGFDLSVAGVAPLAAVVYAKATNGGWAPATAVGAVLVLGFLIGVGNGTLVAWLRINPLITTLATLSITGGLAYVISDGQGIPFTNDAAGFLAEPIIGGIAATVVVWLGLVAVGHVLMRYSVFGRMLYCIGGNPEASWLAGLPVRTITIGSYASCSALAALAGISVASELLSADGSLAADAALVSVAAVVLGGGSLAGGRGSLLGTLVGVLVLGVLQNGLALLQINSFYQQVTTGVVLLLAVGAGAVRFTWPRRTMSSSERK